MTRTSQSQLRENFIRGNWIASGGFCATRSGRAWWIVAEISRRVNRAPHAIPLEENKLKSGGDKLSPPLLPRTLTRLTNDAPHSSLSPGGGEGARRAGEGVLFFFRRHG